MGATKPDLPASWSSDNTFVCGPGGLRFKSRTDQIGLSVASASPLLQHFLRKKLGCPGAMKRRWAPQTRYIFWRSRGKTTKALI